MTVEREISSIETANINKETLDAMKGAQVAMKKIHGDLSIEKVDQTMEDLREQHAIGEEIADALTQGNSMQGVDEDELEDELAELQQEELDNKMLHTGTVPVSDQIQSLPNRPMNERKFALRDAETSIVCANSWNSQREAGSRGRRGGGTTETPGRNGNVMGSTGIGVASFWCKLLLLLDLNAALLMSFPAYHNLQITQFMTFRDECVGPMADISYFQSGGEVR